MIASTKDLAAVGSTGSLRPDLGNQKAAEDAAKWRSQEMKAYADMEKQKADIQKQWGDYSLVHFGK